MEGGTGDSGIASSVPPSSTARLKYMEGVTGDSGITSSVPPPLRPDSGILKGSQVTQAFYRLCPLLHGLTQVYGRGHWCLWHCIVCAHSSTARLKYFEGVTGDSGIATSVPPPPRPDSSIWKGSQVTQTLQRQCPLLHDQTQVYGRGYRLIRH